MLSRIGIECCWIELNKKELSIWYFVVAAKDLLQTIGSFAVQAMVFNDQEKFGNEAGGQTLPSN